MLFKYILGSIKHDLQLYDPITLDFTAWFIINPWLNNNPLKKKRTSIIYEKETKKFDVRLIDYTSFTN